jgi:hypothetical protein
MRKEVKMARKIVDFSARSEIIRSEPFFLHFWESTPTEMLEFLRDPRGELAKMGIELPEECRIETTIENHDWLAARSKNLSADNGTIVCNVGGGNVAKNYYRVSFFAHDESAIAKYEKQLLHDSSEQERLLNS